MENILYRHHQETQGSVGNTYQILEGANFLIDQFSEIQIAQNRIWIQTMALEAGHFSNLLSHKLIGAKKRGVDVKLVYDAFSDYVTDNTFNHLPLPRKEDREFKRFLLEQNRDLLELLRKHFQVTETNLPPKIISMTPFPGILGRDHKKISIIDGVAYIGGINLANLDPKRFDFMLKTDNSRIVEVLASIFEQSFTEQPMPDASYVCDPHNTLLVDSGKPFRSTIMQSAYEAVGKENENITLISPFLPTGHFRKLLNQAVKRGVNVEVITSEINQLGFTPRLSQFVHNLGQIEPLFSILRYPGIVHAKALMFGNHSAMVGSHNFDELFVKLGTEEIALFTTQPEILSQLSELRKRMKEAIN